MTPLIGILSISFLTGGLQAGEAPQLSADRRYGWSEARAVAGSGVQSRALQRDFVLRAELMPDSSPSRGNDTLYERAAATGELRKLAERVEGARKAPDGMLFYVQDSALFALKGDYPEKLLDKSTGDLAFDARGETLALVRLGPTDDPSALDLVGRDGAVKRRLVDGEDALWLPTFTPDKKALVYLSNESGFASFWRVNLDGSERRQLTNRAVQAQSGGVLSQDFVPPAERRESMRFITATVLEYASGDELWQLDVESGRARRVDGQAPTEEGGVR